MTASDVEWIDIMGPKIKHLTPTVDDDGQYAVLLGLMWPGVVVPLHRHEDRETFYVLEGIVEGYLGGSWHRLCAGETLDVPPNEIHAWRNVSDRQVRMLIVTTSKMARFFDEIGRPLASVQEPPSPEDMASLLAASERYGYWLASPQENEAVGLLLQ